MKIHPFLWLWSWWGCWKAEGWSTDTSSDKPKNLPRPSPCAAPKAWPSPWPLAPQHPASSKEARWSHPLLFFFFLTRTRWQWPLCKDLRGRRGFPPTSAEERLMLLVYFQVACTSALWRGNERYIQWWQQCDLLWCWVVFFKVISCMISSHSTFNWLPIFSIFLLVLFSFFIFSALSATFFPMKNTHCKEFA